MILLTHAQRRRIVNDFTSALCHHSEIAAFVDPECLRIHVRSAPFDLSLAFVGQRGRQPLPAGIIAIGAYAHPFPSPEFIRDLLAAIARNERLYPASERATA